jgi:predicted transcriptional regulator
MNIYLTQHIRNQHGMAWAEEYMLGAVHACGRANVTDVLALAINTMAEATAHKYLTNLIEAGYVHQERSKKDKRYTQVYLTDVGKKYLKQIEEV